MSTVAQWLGRKAVVYVLLVLAFAFFVWLWPMIKSELPGSTVAPT